MTRQEAAEKVAKLARLARDNPNPHEAEAARTQARKIVAENNLSVDELSTGQKAAAFDDLVAEVRKAVCSHPALPQGLFGTSDVVSGILTRLGAASKESKARRLDEAGKLIDAASMFNRALEAVGLGTPVVPAVRKIFDETLAAHNLTRHT